MSDPITQATDTLARSPKEPNGGGASPDAEATAFLRRNPDPSRWYHSFCVPKRDGGKRPIRAPGKALKAVQRGILDGYAPEVEKARHRADIGFRKGHSIVNAAARIALAHDPRHQLVVTVDLKDFFGTVSARRVKRIFTRIAPHDADKTALTRVCTLDGKLPQGAPTSPALASIAAAELDAQLERRFPGSYTRYADDLTVAIPMKADTPHVVQKATATQVVAVLLRIVGGQGFSVARSKVRVYTTLRKAVDIVGLKLLRVEGILRRRRACRQRERAILHALERNPEACNEDGIPLSCVAQGHKAYRLMAEGIKVAWHRSAKGYGPPPTLPSRAFPSGT